MYEIESINRIYLEEGKIIFIVRSPIEAPRIMKEYISALGKKIKIDGEIYVVKGIEWHLPATPVSIGEYIAILGEKDLII